MLIIKRDYRGGGRAHAVAEEVASAVGDGVRRLDENRLPQRDNVIYGDGGNGTARPSGPRRG